MSADFSIGIALGIIALGALIAAIPFGVVATYLEKKDSDWVEVGLFPVAVLIVVASVCGFGFVVFSIIGLVDLIAGKLR